MTIDEMRVVITADSSDIDKKIKDITNLFNELKTQISSGFSDKKAFLKELQLIDKINARKQNFQDALNLHNQHSAEKQALVLEQMDERFEQRKRLAQEHTKTAQQKMEERHNLMLRQAEERNLLKTMQAEQMSAYNKRKLDQETFYQQQKLSETNAIKDQVQRENVAQKELQIADETRRKKEEMYERLFVQQREYEKKKALKEQELANKVRQNKEDMYKKLFIQQTELDKKRANKEQELAEKNARKRQELEEKIALRQQELAEKNALKQQELDRKNALKKQKLEDKNAIKNQLNSVFKDMGKKFVGLFAGLQISKKIVDSVKDAMHAIEDESLTEVAFGKQSDAVRKWSKEVSDALGLNLTEVRRNTSTMYSMIRAMNIADTSAMKMAKGVTLLSQDLASMLNKDPKQVYERISAGLMGQTRGLHLMGYAITEATVKQFAYAKGIAKVDAELSEQQKVMSRYLLLMEQTKLAHGNLAQTLNSPMNQLRMFNANLKTLCQTLGNIFIPLLNAVMPYLNAFLKLITMLLNAIRSFFGLPSNEDWAKSLHKGMETANYGFQDLNKGAGELDDKLKKDDKDAKKLLKTLAKFDEMNVLKEPTLKKGRKKKEKGIGGFGEAPFDFPVDDYNPHLEWVQNRVQAIVDAFNKAFAGINFDPLKRSLEDLKKSVKPLLDEIGKNLQWFFVTVIQPLSKWTIEKAVPASIDLLTSALGFLKTTIELSRPATEWFWNNFIIPLGKVAGFAIIGLIEMLTKVLKGLSDWATNNAGAVDFASRIILSFLAGIWIYNTTKPIIKFIKDFTQAIKDNSDGVVTFSGACKTGLKGITDWFNGIGKGAMYTFALQAGMALVVYEIGILAENWNKMNGMEKTIGVIGAVSTALGVLVIAIAGVQSALTMGLAAPLIVGGILAVVGAVQSAKIRAENEFRKSVKMPEVKQSNIVIPWNFPKAAKGGIVNSPTYAQIGENGAEAIVPLENNTGWIDMLASKLGNNGQPINLTVKIGEDNIISRVIDGINNKTMEMGRGMVMV